MTYSRPKHIYNPNIALSTLIIVWQSILITIGVYLSLSNQWYIWLAGQLLLSITFLQCFFLIHEFGHASLFKNRIVNVTLGHIASLFSLLPYYPWKNIHNLHHKWTGWDGKKDPTIPDYEIEDLTEGQVRFMNFCWKNWIPIFAINYTISTFYNPSKLRQFLPSKNIEHLISIGFIAVSFTILIMAIGVTLFLKIWLLAFVLYLSMSDPMLLSQHTHLDKHNTTEVEPTPVRYIDQPLHTRTLIYPAWVEKYIFYGSSRHGLHHQYPWLAGYQLSKIEDEIDNTIHWLKWLKIAKKMPAHRLIFDDYNQTGIKL